MAGGSRGSSKAGGGRPYNPRRHALYTSAELLEGLDDGWQATADRRIQRHFDTAVAYPTIEEVRAQASHDAGVDSALWRLLSTRWDNGLRVVGVMGSHRTPRDSPEYVEAVEIAWHLARHGMLVATGGGPGIMEAGTLGAFLAPIESRAERAALLATLQQVPTFTGSEDDYYRAARQVAAAVPDPGPSLAVPTWRYSNEPLSPFATHVAKYFSNSVREDGLLAVAKRGVVFCPGGAGTLQEIFQDLAQNAYAAFDLRSPMVFYPRAHYCTDVPVFALVDAKARDFGCAGLVGLADSAEEVIRFLLEHPPIPAGAPETTRPKHRLSLAAHQPRT